MSSIINYRPHQLQVYVRFEVYDHAHIHIYVYACIRLNRIRTIPCCLPLYHAHAQMSVQIDRATLRNKVPVTVHGVVTYIEARPYACMQRHRIYVYFELNFLRVRTRVHFAHSDIVCPTRSIAQRCAIVTVHTVVTYIQGHMRAYACMQRHRIRSTTLK